MNDFPFKPTVYVQDVCATRFEFSISMPLPDVFA